MGVDNTWAETSAPMSVHSPAEESMPLFNTYPNRHSTSPTSPVLTESASQHYATGWDIKQSGAPETPPSPSDAERYLDQVTISTDLEPFYSAQDLQDDIRDPCGVPGVRGLRNLGNTCFMSAGIQCLSNTPTLLHFFLLGSPIENIPMDSLTAQFSCLLDQLWRGPKKVVHPGDFKYALGATYPQFKDYRQHDCQEFLALLLDSLHEQLNAVHLSNRFKIEVKSHGEICPASVSTTPPCTPPKVLREKNEYPVKINTVSSTTHLHYYLKDSKTSNVNVAVEDDEPNNTIKFDSDKYPRNDLSSKQKDAHPKHNLASTYNFDNKTVSTKRLKETNLLQERSASGGTSGDGLDFKRIKLTDQNNCCKVKSCVQDSEILGSVAYGSVDAHKHSNNAVLSIVNGINKCVNEKPLKSKESEDGHSSKDESSNSRDEPPLPEEDVQANEHWEKHLALNQSVVVDSFLGQFKSTVICSECKHISVTHEPFMYLSVPLPHAMERLIKVTFVPALDPVAVEYLVTVNKQDSVRQLGEAVLALRSSESYDVPPDATIVLAEGFTSRISKTLDDCVPLRQVNDKNRRIYAIEMLPPPPGCTVATTNLEVTSTEDLDFPSYPGLGAMQQYSRDDYWTASSSASPDSEVNYFSGKKAEAYSVNQDVDMMSLPDSSTNDFSVSGDWAGKPCTATSENVSSYNMDSNGPIIGAWEDHSTPPPLESADFCEDGREPELAHCSSSESSTQSASESSHPAFQKSFETSTEAEEPQANRPVFYGPPLPPADGGFEAWGDIPPRNNLKDRMSFGGSPERNDDCKHCAICLEDATEDMRRHVSCNIILCDNCIVSACKHHGSKDELDCPGCRKFVLHDQEFIRIDKLGDLKPAIRELTVPVVFRLDTEGDGNNNQKTYELFGYPKVLKLPSTLPAKELDSAVGRLVHTDQPYSLLTVDGRGDHCSRCMYHKHCRGCRISTEGEVVLRSGDTIAVRFTEPVDSQMRQHDSLNSQQLPDNKSLTLYDCLKAFSESELLDEHNPWFCPTCKKNQCATKTLSVCRYPDLLIVYLKRFVFHNGISTKLDNKVTYPLNNLIINPQSSHHKDEIAYDLYACVCHVGGVSAGHYTAYAKNPLNSEWYHFNDENVVRQRPQEDDYSNAYILFYQKQDGAFPEINFQEPNVKVNQTTDELGSPDNEQSPRTSVFIDEDVEGD